MALCSSPQPNLHLVWLGSHSAPEIDDMQRSHSLVCTSQHLHGAPFRTGCVPSLQNPREADFCTQCYITTISTPGFVSHHISASSKLLRRFGTIPGQFDQWKIHVVAPFECDVRFPLKTNSQKVDNNHVVLADFE